MDASIQLKIAFQILSHARIPACIVGELSLNYYNVPRVVHDLEVCVPDALLHKAATQLCSTGLFESRASTDFNIYTEYKRGCPRLRATSWLPSPSEIVLFSDRHWNLEPLSRAVVANSKHTEEIAYSNHILDTITSEQIRQLPFPSLSSFIQGLLMRYISTQDPMARMAAEQLVDGMNLDSIWAKSHLKDASKDAQILLEDLIGSKQSRIDDFSDNEITCFVANEQEAAQLKCIPGYS